MQNFVSRFLSNLSGVQRLLAFIFVVTAVSLILAYSAGGWRLTIILGGVILASLWVTKMITVQDKK